MSDLQTVCQKLRGQRRSEGQGGQLGVRGASGGKRGNVLRRALGSDTQLHYSLNVCYPWLILGIVQCLGWTAWTDVIRTISHRRRR